jgi:glutathionylspermidine synthase
MDYAPLLDFWFHDQHQPLWQLFPHHRYLLDTDFEVNDLLKQTGYAAKPIAGRCGSNIDLISAQDELLDKSSGKFVDRKNIYQQLWCLPKVDGKYRRAAVGYERGPAKTRRLSADCSLWRFPRWKSCWKNAPVI